MSASRPARGGRPPDVQAPSARRSLSPARVGVASGAALALSVTAACSGATPSAPAPSPAPDTGAAPRCPAFGVPAALATVTSDAVVEASGLAGSRRTPGYLWLHNDSGDVARLYALTRAGAEAGTFALAGVEADDWEDLALAGCTPGATDPCLFVADIGDNEPSRDTLTLYRVPEPALPGEAGQVATLAAFDALTLEYPDGPHNAEAMVLDPSTGDVYVVTKSDDGVSDVFRASAPLDGEHKNHLLPARTLRFGQGALPGDPRVTGGAASPDGAWIVLRTYDAAFAWPRSPGATVVAALGEAPCPVPLAVEAQGEAIAFAQDGAAILTVSEGEGATVWRIPRVAP